MNFSGTNLYPAELYAQDHPAMRFDLVSPFERAAAATGVGETERAKVLEHLTASIDARLVWAMAHRSTWELDWRYCEQEYSLSNERRADNQRIASVYELDPDDTEDERNEERASVSIPVGLEVVEQQVPRYYDALFGADLDKYVDLIGRDSVDQAMSETVESFLNYQQGHEINTPLVGFRWLRDGCMYGTGIMAQGWDFQHNRRTCESVPLWDMWFDPAAREVDACRWLFWRRTVTVADLMAMREAGQLLFTDASLSQALDEVGSPMLVDHLEQGTITAPGGQELINPDKQVNLYLYMQKERWVYVVNCRLIVAITENQVPPETNSQGKVTARYYPVFTFTPTPAIATETEEPGLYGLSLLSMARTMIDLQNSLTHLMHQGTARTALGVTCMDPDLAAEAINNQTQLKAGSIYPIRDPEKSVKQLLFPDVAGPCLNAINHLDMRLERLHGVNNALRGMATYATETATGKSQDLTQATHRLAQGIKLAYWTMRRFWTVALQLNKAYLEESEYIRVIGEEATWHPISKADMNGIAGKDLVPTGMPLSASHAFLAQQGLNLVTLMQQLKMGGMTDLDDRKVLRDTLVAMGYRNIDLICRREMQVGQDPRQENAILLQGGNILVGPHDDHESHYSEHATLYYVPQARDAFKQDPNLLAKFEAHVATHAQALEGAGQGMEGGKPADGLGSGTGMPGLNSQMPAARPKPAGELQAQMAEQGVPA
jgi:hypothetical protein